MLELLLALISTLTGIDRTVDADLMAVAQARSAAVTCDGCFNHDGKPDGVAEILIWHQGDNWDYEDAVLGWLASPPHAGVLLNPAYTRIGCGYTYSAETNGHYFACELAVGEPIPASEPTSDVPNTAMAPSPIHEFGWVTAIGILCVVAVSAATRPRRRARWKE